MRNKQFNRRSFLRSASASAIAPLSQRVLLGGLGAGAAAMNARAADISGYRALVCVFLLGGLDNHDTLLPFDQSSYDRYAEIRAPLLDLYAQQAGGSSRDRARLLSLSPSNAGDFGGREFAFPEDFSGLRDLFDAGDAAIVANVGPLIEAVDRDSFEAESAVVPPRLFSHNDQQSTWQANSPEGAQFGWGGLFGDAALASGANPVSDFTSITSLGNELFLTGLNTAPYQVNPDGGASTIDLLENFRFLFLRGDTTAAEALLRDHFRAANDANTNLLARDLSNASQSAFDANESFNTAFESLTPLTTMFPTTFLGNQLRSIAQTIAIRGSLQADRQIFLAALGGFDTHSSQAQDLPGLQREVNDAIVAFNAAMQELGVSQDVTLFTASDFGRTLAINGDGTDHGWGGHHLVVGGAVNGGAIYGDIPPYDFNHSQDAGGGRLIPGISIEQYAAPLGRWFGLNDAEIGAALPGLATLPGPSPLAFV